MGGSSVELDVSDVIIDLVGEDLKKRWNQATF